MDHELKKTTEMTFACKKCKKVFRKDILMFEGNTIFMQKPTSTVLTVITSTSSTPSPKKINESATDSLFKLYSPKLSLISLNALSLL